MSLLTALLLTGLIGLGVPILAIAICSRWTMKETWDWRCDAVSVFIACLCINAPYYSAVITGLLPADSAIRMHLITLGLFGVCTLLHWGNYVEGYVLALIVSFIITVTLVAQSSGQAADEDSLVRLQRPSLNRHTAGYVMQRCVHL